MLRLLARSGLVLCCLVGLLPGGYAQQTSQLNDYSKKSHNLDLFPLPSGDNESALLSRLQGRKVREMLKNDPKFQAAFKNDPAMRERVAQMLKNPAFAKLLKDSGIDLTRPELAKENGEKLMGLMANLKAKTGSTGSASNLGFSNQGKSSTSTQAANPQVDPDSSKSSLGPSEEGPRQSDAPTTGGGPAASAAQGPQVSSEWTKRLAQWAEKMQKMDPSLSKSKAVQDIIKSFSQPPALEDPRWKTLADQFQGASDKLKDWSKDTDWNKLLPKNTPQWNVNWLPKDALNFSLGGKSAALPSIPNSLPSTSGGDSNTWAVMLALLGIGTLVFWMLRNRGAAVAWAKAQRQKLGPWPVDLATLRTRGELIAAFEYLALLTTGPMAKSRNHRMLESELAERLHAPSFCARRAADAYELARYEPDQGPLPEKVLVEARENLATLAKAAGS